MLCQALRQVCKYMIYMFLITLLIAEVGLQIN